MRGFSKQLDSCAPPVVVWISGCMWMFTSDYSRLAVARLTGCHLVKHMEQLPAVWYSTVRVTGGMTASKWHHLSHSYSQTSSGLQAEAQHRLYLHLQSDSLHARSHVGLQLLFTFSFLFYCLLNSFNCVQHTADLSVCWSEGQRLVHWLVDQQLFSTKNAFDESCKWENLSCLRFVLRYSKVNIFRGLDKRRRHFCFMILWWAILTVLRHFIGQMIHQETDQQINQ